MASWKIELEIKERSEIVSTSISRKEDEHQAWFQAGKAVSRTKRARKARRTHVPSELKEKEIYFICRRSFVAFDLYDIILIVELTLSLVIVQDQDATATSVQCTACRPKLYNIILSHSTVVQSEQSNSDGYKSTGSQNRDAVVSNEI